MEIKQNSNIIIPLDVGKHNPKAFSKIQAKASQRLDFASQNVKRKLNLILLQGVKFRKWGILPLFYNFGSIYSVKI